MKYELNQRARQLVERMAAAADDFRIRESSVQDARIFDFGIRVEGGLDAGQALAEICMAGLGWASILPGDVGGLQWPHVFVTTDHPVAACLYSQYAGWQISTDGFFAMGSGPMRAVHAREELFMKLGYREEPSDVVGVLEGRKLPNANVVQHICERIGITSDKLILLIAPTASQAGQCASRRPLGGDGTAQAPGVGIRRAADPSACGALPCHLSRPTTWPVSAARTTPFCMRASDSLGARRTTRRRPKSAPRCRRVPRRSSANRFRKLSKPQAATSTRSTRACSARPRLRSAISTRAKFSRFGRTEPDVLKTSFGIDRL